MDGRAEFSVIETAEARLGQKPSLGKAKERAPKRRRSRADDAALTDEIVGR